MKKRKPGSFTAAKAVKALARERVGQPKPVRRIENEARVGHREKHKQSLGDLLRGREEQEE